jgi:hypothetical protein
MHDLLLAHQDALSPRDLVGYAEQLDLDVDRFSDELEAHRMGSRIGEDVEGADLSIVAGTPFVTAAATMAPTTSAASPRRYMPPARERRSPPSDQTASGGLLLIVSRQGEVFVLVHVGEGR